MASCLRQGEETPATEIASFWYPLDYCYRRQELQLPRLEQVSPEAIPEPYRSLVVHQRDMTPTLETFHQDEIYIEVIHRDYSDTHYFREVVLKLKQTDRPVEFGAIRIYLERMPPEAREAILKERIPLGHILDVYNVQHTSKPIGYLRMVPDELIQSTFGESEEKWLYGRRNRLTNPAGESLAEIIEILPDFRMQR